YGHPLVSGSGKGKTLTLKLDRPTRVDQVVLMEDITQGERVRRFSIEGRAGRHWVDLYNGFNIGHKHIVQFAPREVSAIRLSVTESKAEPRIQSIQAFKAIK